MGGGGGGLSDNLTSTSVRANMFVLIYIFYLCLLVRKSVRVKRRLPLFVCLFGGRDIYLEACQRISDD